MHSSWTAGQVAEFEEVVHGVGGPFEATPARVLLEMSTCGLNADQLGYGLTRLRMQIRDAGVSRVVDEAVLQKSAQKASAPRSWTSDQAAAFDAAVHAMGGPFKATPALVLVQMPGSSLPVRQISYGLERLRKQAQAAGRSPDTEVVRSTLRQGLAWPADLFELVNAAVLTQGGLEWATPACILTLVSDPRLNASSVAKHLHRCRRLCRKDPLGSPAQGRRAPITVDAARSSSAAPSALVGGGPPHGWSPKQRALFLAAVHACGGSSASTTRSVRDWMRQHGAPEEALSRKQGDIGLRRLRETLRHAALSGAFQATGVHDARTAEASALASLWVQGGLKIRWTPELRSRLGRAVDQLGGPAAAKTMHLIPLLVGSGLTHTQVEGGLRMLRDRHGTTFSAWDDRWTALSPATLGEVLSAAQPAQPQSRLKWTADLEERFAAAVRQLGGLECAGPKSLTALMSGSGLRVGQVNGHMQWLRHKARKAGSHDGGDGGAAPSAALPPEAM